jgi:hypothetical protein
MDWNLWQGNTWKGKWPLLAAICGWSWFALYTGIHLLCLSTQIVTICYPPHASHLLQGLDVAVFGRFKVVFADVCNEFENASRLPVDKDSLLYLIGTAYNQVFIPSTIKSAFRATGIWPFNRNAVLSVALALAEATSTLADGPVPMPTVVRNVVRAFISLPPIKALNYGEVGETSTSIFPQNGNTAHTLDNPFISLPPNQSPNGSIEPLRTSPRLDLALRHASAIRNATLETTFRHIVSESPARGSDPLVPVVICPISSMRLPDFSLLDEATEEANLTNLQHQELVRDLCLELDLAWLQIDELSTTVNSYQAHMIVGSLHAKKLQTRLVMHETKAAGKDTNILIKPDGSSGRVISSEEAEQYEIARVAQEAQEAAEKDAQSKVRDLARESKQVAKEAKDVAKAELTRLSKADLELWEAAVVAWREIVCNWPKGNGKKPLKPKKPKVCKGPLPALGTGEQRNTGYSTQRPGVPRHQEHDDGGGRR